MKRLVRKGVLTRRENEDVIFWEKAPEFGFAASWKMRRFYNVVRVRRAIYLERIQVSGQTEPGNTTVRVFPSVVYDFVNITLPGSPNPIEYPGR